MVKQKRLWVWVTAIFLILLVCGQGWAQESSVKNALIGVAAFEGAHDWPNWVRTGIDDMTAQYGLTVEKTMANWDPVKFLQDVENLLTKGAKVIIIISGEHSTLIKAVEKCKAENVPVIFCDGGETQLPGIVCNISSNNLLMGYQLMDTIAKKMGGQGTVVLFKHPISQVTVVRMDGIKQCLANYPKIKVLEEQTNTGPDYSLEGKRIMQGVLQRYPNKGSIGAVVGTFDMNVFGAAAACDEANRKEIIIGGIDALLPTLQMIRTGSSFQATVCQRPREIGRLTIDMAMRLLEGKRQVPTVIQTPSIAYTKENLPPDGDPGISKE